MRRRIPLRRVLPLALSLTLLSTILVGQAMSLTGTPVIPGCPCVFFGTMPGDGARAISLEALFVGALLAFAVGALSLLAVLMAFALVAPGPGNRTVSVVRSDDAIRSGRPPLRSTMTISSRKMRFRRASSTSFAGLTHSAV